MLYASCFKQHTSKGFSLAEWNRWRASCIRTAFASRVVVVGGKLVQKWRNSSHSDMYRFFNSRSRSAGTSSEKHKISLWYIFSISLVWYVEIWHKIRPQRSLRKRHVSHQHTECALFFLTPLSNPFTPCAAKGIHEELPGIVVSSYPLDLIPWSSCASYFILYCPSSHSLQPTSPSIFLRIPI